MPNRFLKPSEVGKMFLEDMIREVKRVSPDKPGQDPEILNSEQDLIFRGVFNTISRKMFYGRSPF